LKAVCVKFKCINNISAVRLNLREYVEAIKVVPKSNEAGTLLMHQLTDPVCKGQIHSLPFSFLEVPNISPGFA
jgi:hypothetical protein